MRTAYDPDDIVARFKPGADEVVCLATPMALFFAVGRYRNFTQTSDDEVVAFLIVPRDFCRRQVRSMPPTYRFAMRRSRSLPVQYRWQGTDCPRKTQGIVVFALWQWQPAQYPQSVRCRGLFDRGPGLRRCYSTCSRPKKNATAPTLTLKKPLFKPSLIDVDRLVGYLAVDAARRSATSAPAGRAGSAGRGRRSARERAGGGVSRRRPDLAGDLLGSVVHPTLLIADATRWSRADQRA